MLSLRTRRAAIVVALLLLVVVLGVACAGASACPNETMTGFRAYLPDCRAYELVSPGYTEGFPVFVEGASEDGEQLLTVSFGSFSNPDNTSSAGQSYLIKREKSGWQSTPLDEPFSSFPVYHVQGMSANFASSLWFASTPGQSARAGDVYLDLPLSGESARGHLVRVGPGVPSGVVQSELTFVGASEELSHVLLLDHSPGGGGEEDRLWPGDTTVPGRHPSLYEYEGTGNFEPRLVGVSNEGLIEEAASSEGKQHINEAAKLISNCGTNLGSASEEDAYNAVSLTGGTVFFTAEACGGSPTVNEVYARIDGEKTVAISEPVHPLAQGSGSGSEECDATCEADPLEPAVFQGASEDGSKVFFLTSQPLLNGDKDTKTDLYEVEIEGEGVHARIGKLVQVSRDPNAGQAADVQGVARVSEDGSHVYFVATGRLTKGSRGGGKIGVYEGLDAEGVCLASLNPVEKAEEAKAEEQEAKGEEVTFGARCRPKTGDENLYVYERDVLHPNGHTSFVATLSPADGGDWSTEDARPVQATPDGRFLVFQSVADLTSDQEGRADAGQVFEYDAQTEGLVRVSQGEDGYNDDGNTDIYSATIPVQNRAYSGPEEHFRHLAVSEDGSRVFFSSADPLTPQALNGVCVLKEEGICVSYANNIYEYRDGKISMISDGHDVLSVEGSPATALIGTDESGRDVFLTTADRLTSENSDTLVNIYDAREGGGFALAEELAPCSPGACKGPGSELLPLVAPVTMSAAEPAGSTPSAITQTKPKAKIKPKVRRVTRRRRRRGTRKKAEGKKSRRSGL
jgi:hypothetical protein